MLVYPHYYPRFACLAGECGHSCCKGWEIDIDPDSLLRFRALNDIAPYIEEGDPPFFRLREDGSCPFLREDGLCRMIIDHGPDILCDICADHPRYRNFFSDRTELGLGMCCEAAARLILREETPIRMLREDDGIPGDPLTEDEACVLSVRDELLRALTDRSVGILQRFLRLCAETNCPMPEFSGEEAFRLLSTLERLDPDGPSPYEPLRALASVMPQSIPTDRRTAYEQIACYYILRHIAPAAEDDMLYARVRLCCFLWQVTVSLIDLGGPFDIDAAAEVCRVLSAEIEYSDENIQCLLEALDE